MTTPLRSFFVSVLVVAGLLVSFSAQAATVQWFPNPEPDIAGYKLSYGTQSGVYTTSIDVGKATTWQLTLAPGQRYFIVVQAYNTAGGTSPYSAEAVYDAPPAPSVTTLSPTIGPVGTAVTIGGSNFGASQGASTVTFNGTGATPTAWSATSITVPVPVGATSGNVVVTVAGRSSPAVPFLINPASPQGVKLKPQP